MTNNWGWKDNFLERVTESGLEGTKTDWGVGFWWEYLVRTPLGCNYIQGMFLHSFFNRVKATNKLRVFFCLFGKGWVKKGWNSDVYRIITIKISPEKNQCAPRTRKSTSQATKSCEQRDVFRKLDRVLNPSACVKVPVSHLPEQLWASLPCSGDGETLKSWRTFTKKSLTRMRVPPSAETRGFTFMALKKLQISYIVLASRKLWVQPILQKEFLNKRREAHQPEEGRSFGNSL